MRILLIEDEGRLAGYVARALEKAGHAVEIRPDGAEGWEAAKAGAYDLAVLDVNLPSLDGLTVLRRIREAHLKLRVLMLTARGEVGDRVAGLRAGADDYLGKPFAMDELVARVEALGRRSGTGEEILAMGELRLEVHRRRVSYGSKPLELSPRELDVLRLFMEEPGRVFSRDELSERIWERQHEYDTRTIEVFIMRLRRKLEECPGAPTIETVRGSGYRLRESPPA